MYEYHFQIDKVVDGDTMNGRIDLGCDVTLGTTLRLAGINAPEMSTPAGVMARQYVLRLLGVDTNPVLIRTWKDRTEKYGRYLAWVQLLDGSWLNQAMVDSGNAVVYSLNHLLPTPPATS